MRVLLFVFVVAMIGLMIPNAFAQSGTNCQQTEDGCRIQITTDKQTYQSDEIVTVTAEIFGMNYFATEYYLMDFSVLGNTETIYFCNTITPPDCPLSIRVGEPLTFQFKPEILPWKQEYKIHTNLIELGLQEELLITVLGVEPERETMVSEMQEKSNGGGCLIATATFGSEMVPQVQFLREIRDNTVIQTEAGNAFMTGFNHFYYSFSPAIADYERENPIFKEAVKLTLTPLLTSLSLLQYADIDSESEMLGYGIGIILLNIGMYFVAPVVVIMKVSKRIKL